MEIILLQKVENLGGLGDKVKVSAGHARNLLIPKGMAVPATPERIKEFEAKRAELEKIAAQNLAEAQKRESELEGLEITITAKSAGAGKLYGSIGTVDVAEAIAQSGRTIERREVRLPEGPIREAGEYDVILHLHTDVDVPIKVIVVAEE
ncbi:MAG: 50S ribosomal protein L9 [Pseudomonadota bacterium]|nr:50S ribosomal protein L9 [Pseudomonadota bacterium]